MAVNWCPGWDLNPHSPYGKRDFKSLASADFATRAWIFNQSFAAAARFAILTTLVESLGTTDSLIPRIAAFIASADGCTYFRETLMMLAP